MFFSQQEEGKDPDPPCQWTCELTNAAGYVVYSALGSFYIPMFVMLFFYWRIYKAAVRTTKAINQGFRTTRGEAFQTWKFKTFWDPYELYHHGQVTSSHWEKVTNIAPFDPSAMEGRGFESGRAQIKNMCVTPVGTFKLWKRTYRQ